MIVHAPETSGDDVTIRCETDDGRAHTATFRLPSATAVDPRADAAIAATLLPAMARREQITTTAPVSARLLAGIERFQDVWLTWDRVERPTDPWFARVAIDAEPAATDDATDADADDRRGRACFFTGGVDSFHSAIRHRDELDALVFVHGFDMPADRNLPFNRQVAGRLHDAADQLGLPLIEVESDLVAFSQGFELGWEDYHGAALATIAILLSDRFSTVYVPATTTYSELYPLGSHPVLDPLWSTDRVTIVHDGADATRIEKLAAIAAEPAAAQHLRVCQDNPDDLYNCGTCEKCIRTGVGARIAGVDGAFASLPSPSLAQVARVEIKGLGTSWRGYRDHLVRTRANDDLRRAIDLALLRRRVRTGPLRRWVGADR